MRGKKCVLHGLSDQAKLLARAMEPRPKPVFVDRSRAMHNTNPNQVNVQVTFAIVRVVGDDRAIIEPVCLLFTSEQID